MMSMFTKIGTIQIMKTSNYTAIFTMVFGMLINDVLLLLFHIISIKIIESTYKKHKGLSLE